MLTVKIEDDEVHERDTKNGKFRNQFGMVELKGERRRIKIPLKNGQHYPKGIYVLSPESIYIGRWNDLELYTILQPAKAS